MAHQGTVQKEEGGTQTPSISALIRLDRQKVRQEKQVSQGVYASQEREALGQLRVPGRPSTQSKRRREKRTRQFPRPDDERSSLSTESAAAIGGGILT